MFLPVLAVVLIGFAVHTRRARAGTVRAAELLLRWVLVGYCGLPMVAVAVLALVAPDATLARFGFEVEGVMTVFFGWAYLGMALAAVTALVGRPSTLLAPAITWAVFFTGATGVHLHAGHGSGDGSGHGGMLYILSTHALITVLLVAGVVLGGTREPRAGRGAPERAAAPPGHGATGPSAAP